MTRSAEALVSPLPAPADPSHSKDIALTGNSAAPADFARLMQQAVQPSNREACPVAPQLTLPEMVTTSTTSKADELLEAEPESTAVEDEKEADAGCTVSFLAELAAAASWTPPPAVPPNPAAESREATTANDSSSNQPGYAYPSAGQFVSDAATALPDSGATPTSGLSLKSEELPQGASAATPAGVPPVSNPTAALPGVLAANASPSSSVASAGNPAQEQAVTPLLDVADLTVAAAQDPDAQPKPGEAQISESSSDPTGETDPTEDSPQHLPGSSEDGMSTALHSSAMRAMRQMNKNAAPAEQDLPRETVTAETSHSSGRAQKSNAGAESVVGMRGAEVVLGATSQPPGLESDLVPAEVQPSTANAIESVQRTLDHAALTLKRMDSASVSMVLKPDGHTQLSLHMKWQGGHLEALAVLERGNLDALNSEWSQLQQRLGDQGVRLAPLVSSAGQTVSSGGGQFDSPQQQPQQRVLESGLVEGRSLTRKPVRSSGVQTQTAPNGREWWA